MMIDSRQELIAAAIALVALVVGLLVRVQGLGTWPFEVDEYYLAKATTSILQNGLPNFECGGFYTRGLLQQYVSAGAMLMFENSELAMRLYPVAFSVGSLWVALRLGHRLGGPVVGYLLLALMSLSLWEIEFARFARMYAPFQFLALMQVYLLVKVLFDTQYTYFKWMILVCLLGIVTYEAAIFLALPIFVALARVPQLRKAAPIIMTGAVVALSVAYVLIPFRTLGVPPPELPADVVATLADRSGALISLPQLAHLTLLPGHPVWLAGLMILLVGSAASALRWLRGSGLWVTLAWFVAIVCFGLSLVPLGLVIFLAATLLMLDGDGRRQARRVFVRGVLPSMFILLTFWGLFLLIELDMSLKPVAKTLLKYPNLLDPVAYVFWDAVPVLCVVLLSPILTYGIATLARDDRRGEEFICLAALAACFLVGVALLNPNSHETRYSFFVYPLVLCLFCLAVTRLAERLPLSNSRLAVAVPPLLFAFFAMTEDFRIRHYLAIDSAEINFRTQYSPDLQEHFKFRDDNRTPAEYVNARLAPGDSVIIAESGVDMYVAQVDFRYKDAAGTDFVNHISCGLEHDVWSNAPVLYSEEQLRDVIEAAHGTVWIIKRNFTQPVWLEEHEVHLAADGRMQVLEVSPMDETLGEDHR